MQGFLYENDYSITETLKTLVTVLADTNVLHLTANSKNIKGTRYSIQVLAAINNSKYKTNYTPTHN